MQLTINKKALGRAHHLGSLYDIRSDNFCGVNIFNEEISPYFISTIETYTTNYQYNSEETIQNKLNAFNLDAELKLSVLTGLFKLEGAGQYLSNNKQSDQSLRCTLISENRTVSEEINLFNNQVQQSISTDAIQSSDATHIVVGIKWGANVIISFEYNDDINENKTEIGESLALLIDKLKNFGGQATFSLNDEEAKLKTKFSIVIHGDLALNGQSLSTVEEAVWLMNNLHEFINKINNGKGVPLEYVLFPINKLSFLSPQPHIQTQEVRLSVANLVEQKFDFILSKKQKLFTQWNNLIKNEKYINKQKLDNLMIKKSQFEILETTLKEDLGQLFVQVRSNQADAALIEKFLQNEYEELIKVIEQLLNDCLKLEQKFKINKINDYQLFNIKYLSRDDDIDELELRHLDKDVYVLFTLNSKRLKQAIKENFILFYKLRKQNQDDMFYVVNSDIFTRSINNEPRIDYYSKGKLTATDLLNIQKKELNQFIEKLETEVVKLTTNDSLTQVTKLFAKPIVEIRPTVIYKKEKLPETILSPTIDILIRDRLTARVLDYDPCAIIVGKRGCGKTTLVKKICNINPKLSQTFKSIHSPDSRAYEELTKYRNSLRDVFSQSDFNTVFIVIKYESRLNSMLDHFLYEKKAAGFSYKKLVLIVSHGDCCDCQARDFVEICEKFGQFCQNIIFYSDKCDNKQIADLVFSCMSNMDKEELQVLSYLFA